MGTSRRLWHAGMAVLGLTLVLAADPAPTLEVTPPAVAETPSPAKSPGSLPPLLPPEGLPTAPPPDAIKPVVPQAQIDAPAGGA